MKLNLGREMFGLTGEPIKLKQQNSAPATLAELVIEVLMGEHQKDANSEGKHKMRRYHLARSIQNGNMDFPVEDVALFKDRAAMFYGAAIYGPFCEAIEAPALKEAEA